MLTSSLIFLQQADGGGMTQTLIMFGAMFAVFYFFMIRPQAKKQKEQRNFEASLEKGAEVVTVSGIIGRVNKVEGEVVTLEVGNKVFIPFTKNAISNEMTAAHQKAAQGENA